MRSKLIHSICLLSGILFTMGCGPEKTAADAPKEPELTLYSLALHVVDEQTGEVVPKITSANFALSDAAASHSNAASKASRRIVASQEGIVIASWIGPIGGAKGLVIEAEGYEPITIAPDHDGHLSSNKIGPNLSKYLRTVKMKKIQGEQEETEGDDEEAGDGAAE